jgi:hypothetical protein
LTEAATDSRPLSNRGATYVNAALAIPLPPKISTIRQGRRRFAITGGGRLLPGLTRVALAAASRLAELTEDAAERLLDIAGHAPAGKADAVFAALQRAGVDTSRRWANFFEGMSTWMSSYKTYETALLDDMVSLAEFTHDLDESGSWSLTEIGDLMTATGYLEVGVGEFDRAFIHDSIETRRSWLDAMADAYGIDKSAVSKQARYLLRIGSGNDVAGADWLVAMTKPPSELSLSPDLDKVISASRKQELLVNLEADSDWIAWSAAGVIVEFKEAPAGIGEIFEKDMSSWPRQRSGLLYMVAILCAGDRSTSLLRRAAESDSADYRYAATMAISASPDLDADGSTREALRRDPDASVRPEGVGKTAPAPTFWTCDDCRAINDIAAVDCSACDAGVRRGARPDQE